MGTYYLPMKDKILQVAIKAIGESGLERTIDLGPEWFSRWKTPNWSSPTGL